MVIPYRKAHKKSLLSRLIKWVMILAIFITVILSVMIFMFNGNKVKKPLTDFLNNKLNADFSVSAVEFSPLYPNTIKLINPAFGDKLEADEIYIEVDLGSLITNKVLAIDDLYIKNLRINSETADFLQQKLSVLNLNSVSIEALRIDGMSTNAYGIKAANSRIRLYGLTVAENFMYSAQTGSVAFHNGSFLQIPFKDLSFSFSQAGEQINLSDLHAVTLGGSLSGSGTYNTDGSLTFNRLNLNKLILKEGGSSLTALNINGNNVSFNDCLYTTDNVLIAGITGNSAFFTLANGKIMTDFKGSVDEISMPQHHLSITDATLSTSIRNSEVSGNLNGTLFDGELSFNFNYQQNDETLAINKLILKNNKIEYGSDLQNTIKSFIEDRQIDVESCSFSKLSFVSHLNELPLNILEFSGNMDNLSIIKGKIQNRKAGIVNLDINALTYSDLLLNKIKIIATVSPDLLSVSAPEIKFRTSDVSLSGTLALKEGPSFLLLQGRNFNLADLNSNLSRRLLSGRADLEINLQSFGNLDQITENLDGSFYLKSPEMLISNLALDYLNGGDSTSRTFNLDELSAALYEKDCGIYDLTLLGSVKCGILHVSGNFNLSSDNVTASLRLDLSSMLLSALGLIENQLEGNKTQILIGEKISDPQITVKPLERHTLRPGLADLDLHR